MGGDKSGHLVARWYRPPEIILGDNNYDAKVDVWSLGCIIAEIFHVYFAPENKDEEPWERYLFRGTSCLDLSPMQSEEKKKGEDKKKIQLS